jgi:hypothetical protein
LYAIGDGGGAGSSTLYKIANYATTPTAVVVGPTGLVFPDLAINPITAIGYGVGEDHYLYTIDLNTGAATKVGPTGTTALITGLDFSPVGTLYAMAIDDTHLFTIDPATGAVTTVFDTRQPSLGRLASMTCPAW